jgi:hypothetical protein
VSTFKRVLESNLTLNLLASGLTVFLAGFFWVDLGNSANSIGLNQLIRIAVLILAIVTVYLIWKRDFATLPILFLVYTGSYFLYQLLFSKSWPIYIILLALFAILWLIFPLFHIKSSHGLYFFLFVLVLFEVFVALSYWLVNPISRSLIMATTAYLYGGWLTSLDMKKTDLNRYFIFAILSFVIILFTMRWGI